MNEDRMAIADLLKKASATLLTLLQEREQLQVKLAELEERIQQHETEARIHKLAEMMGSKGPYVGTSFQERVQLVREKIASGQATLDDLERALNVIAPDGSLGELAGSTKVASAKAEFERLMAQTIQLF